MQANPADIARRVHVARSQPRDALTGWVCFDVTDTNGDKWRAPLKGFMDLATNEFENEEVADAVNDWIAVAKEHPYTRRKCVCCRERAWYGKITCRRHGVKYGEVIYAVQP